MTRIAAQAFLVALLLGLSLAPAAAQERVLRAETSVVHEDLPLQPAG